MAATRDPRKTAGNRLSNLLQDEAEEEFYKTAWGGFAEEVDDAEYELEGSGDDDVDSDFDNPENEADEPLSDGADDEKKRKKRVVLLGQKRSKPQSSEKKRKIRRKVPDRRREDLRKSSRVAVVQNSRALRVRLEEEEIRRQSRRPRRRQTMRKLTQEETLREAKITEMENLASLNVYIQLEEEKKKLRTIKKPVIAGPVVRFQSLTMPDVESNDPAGRKICSRNFLTFTDATHFPQQYFPSQVPAEVPERSYCVVTGLPARYRDSVTHYPYVNSQAFRILRQHHARGTLAALITSRDRLKTLSAAARLQHQPLSQSTNS